jgi:phage shock protein A
MADDIQRTLGRLESKLDAVLATQNTTNDRLNNHSARISVLERWQSKVLGAVAIVSLIAGALVKTHWLK